jgi:hypothetical protein
MNAPFVFPSKRIWNNDSGIGSLCSIYYVLIIFELCANHHKGPFHEGFRSKIPYVFIHHKTIVTFPAQLA